MDIFEKNNWYLGPKMAQNYNSNLFEFDIGLYLIIVFKS